MPAFNIRRLLCLAITAFSFTLTAADEPLTHAQKTAALKSKLGNLPGFKDDIERIFKGLYDLSLTDSDKYGKKDGVVTVDEIIKRKAALPSNKRTPAELAEDAKALMQSWQEKDKFPDDNPDDDKLNLNQAMLHQFQFLTQKYGSVMKEVADNLMEERAARVTKATDEVRSKSSRTDPEAKPAKRKTLADQQREKTKDDEARKAAEGERKEASKAVTPLDVLRRAWEMSF